MPISYKRYNKNGNEIASCTATLDENCIKNPDASGCSCDPGFLDAGERLEWVCKGV